MLSYYSKPKKLWIYIHTQEKVMNVGQTSCMFLWERGEREPGRFLFVATKFILGGVPLWSGRSHLADLTTLTSVTFRLRVETNKIISLLLIFALQISGKPWKSKNYQNYFNSVFIQRTSHDWVPEWPPCLHELRVHVYKQNHVTTLVGFLTYFTLDWRVYYVVYYLWKIRWKIIPYIRSLYLL